MPGGLWSSLSGPAENRIHLSRLLQTTSSSALCYLRGWDSTASPGSLLMQTEAIKQNSHEKALKYKKITDEIWQLFTAKVKQVKWTVCK